MLDTAETIAIIGGTLIDGNGGPPIEDSVIVIDGKQIIVVGDRSTQVPPRAKRIVATGKFVIPGLMNAHVYLVEGFYWAPLIRFEGRYHEVAIETAQLALKNGVTTVFDTWGPRDSLIAARDAINQGRVTGARIYCAGNIVGYDGPISGDFRQDNKIAMVPIGDVLAARIDAQWQFNVGQALVLMPAQQVREEVRKYVRSGIDFLNLAVADHRACQYIVFSPRVQQLIVEEAHQAGLRVLGNAPLTTEALHLAVDAGLDVTFACVQKGISAETIEHIVQRKFPCIVFPSTAKACEWYKQRGIDHTPSVDSDARALLQAGATVLLGTQGVGYSTDALNGAQWKQWHAPHDNGQAIEDGHFIWLRAMEEKGMAPMELLMAATRNVAEAFRVDKDLGTLECGKLADLLVLDRNPLEKAENYRSISLVLKEGKVIDRDALPTQRLVTAESESSSGDWTASSAPPI